MTDPGLIAAIVGLLGLLGSGVGWYVNRRDKSKPGIPKTAAELAVAAQALGIIETAAARQEASAQRVEAEVDRMGGALNDERERGDRQQREIDTLRDDLEKIKTLLSHAARYIETLLRAWPPGGAAAPAVPAPLDELIDTTLHPDD